MRVLLLTQEMIAMISWLSAFTNKMMAPITVIANTVRVQRQ